VCLDCAWSAAEVCCVGLRSSFVFLQELFVPSKKERMQAYFHIIDKDNNGTVDTKELSAMMRRVNAAELEGLSAEDAEEEVKAMAQEILEAVDSNEDGVIQWDEFKVLDF